MDRPDDSALLEALHEHLGWRGSAVSQRELLSNPGSQTIVERLQISNHRTAPSSVVLKAVPAKLRSRFTITAVPADTEAAIHDRLLEAEAPLPEVFWHGWDSAHLWHMMFSEDVALRAELGTWDRCWTEEEMNAVIRAIARFHGAGHELVRELEKQCSGVSARPPACIDGIWLQRLLSRIPDSRSIPSDELRPLERVCERYDIWKKQLRPYDTLVHGDIFMGNVAVFQAASGEKEALILDVEMAAVGSPHLDIEYCSQRGWQTGANWDTLRDRYRQHLTALFPCFECDDEIWRWGYRLALLQLKLWWHFHALPIAEAGDNASEEERAFLSRGGGLCNAEFLETCRLAVREDPWL